MAYVVLKFSEFNTEYNNVFTHLCLYIKLILRMSMLASLGLGLIVSLLGGGTSSNNLCDLERNSGMQSLSC